MPTPENIHAELTGAWNARDVAAGARLSACSGRGMGIGSEAPSVGIARAVCRTQSHSHVARLAGQNRCRFNKPEC